MHRALAIPRCISTYPRSFSHPPSSWLTRTFSSHPPNRHTVTKDQVQNAKTRKPNSAPNSLPENPSFGGGDLIKAIRELKRPARWVLYFGFGLLATAESTFWFNVIRAKFFAKEDDVKSQEFLERVKEAVKGYRYVWLPNYRRYYEAHMWGI